jgi:hypothetical protein
MRSSLRRPVVSIVTLASLLTTGMTPVAMTLPAQGVAPNVRWSAVDAAFGRAGAPQPGGVMRYAFPRSDLTVVVNGVTVKPALGLGGWVAFMPMGRGQSMAMGDLVLTEDEVGGVMRALQQGGVEQTALHNHLAMESPHVMYLHIHALGDPAAIAATIRTALATTRTPLGAPAAPAAASAADLDTAGIARALGYGGKLNGVVYQVSVPRAERIMENGHEVPPSMGVATAINFQPTGGGKAAITGDFVLRAREVNAVIRALEAHGIASTAVHSHMLEEEPRLFFMHFWANDDAVTLASGLRAALDRTASKKANALAP